MGTRSVFEPDDMAALCASGQARRYRAGECVFGEGELSDHVCVIRRGGLAYGKIRHGVTLRRLATVRR